MFKKKKDPKMYIDDNEEKQEAKKQEYKTNI